MSEQSVKDQDISEITETEAEPKRKRGRQPIDPADRKIQITFTLSPALLAKVNEKAREHSMSRTAFINLALDNACRCGIAPISKADLISFLKEINK
ncbi:MAG: hypothetical protein IAB19_07600 [Proteobacteria bacterium]|uniref:Ribbon-helix-helix protein CopG domain-containing protein n=1 Tax=Candidatus Avisuccinivibrio stercorigallinarum TaxID=2840704 RepID=A0A9D9DAQ9_9GAMM|nr:hypothetical protein [Candidatus Avisuccinivibrio stercorigallinarum]